VKAETAIFARSGGACEPTMKNDNRNGRSEICTLRYLISLSLSALGSLDISRARQIRIAEMDLPAARNNAFSCNDILPTDKNTSKGKAI